jgi:hypothetical protein
MNANFFKVVNNRLINNSRRITRESGRTINLNFTSIFIYCFAS